MKYNLLMELKEYGIGDSVAEKIYRLLSNIVEKPGQIKIEVSNLENGTLEVKNDRFSVFIKFKINHSNTIEGRITKKMVDNDYYSVSIKNGKYCAIHVIMDGEKAGIYEELSENTNDSKNGYIVRQNYYDTETLNYLLSKDSELIY